MTGLPNPFFSAGAPHDAPPAETLPAMISGNEHLMAGSRFSIDEDSFFYAIDPPPLELEAIEIEQVLRALFARTA